jgi:hypothetical protein
MDINEKLDTILSNQEAIQEQLEEISDKQDRLEEGIANISLPGAGYSIFSPDES